MIDPNWLNNLLVGAVSCFVTSIAWYLFYSIRKQEIKELNADKAFYKEKYEQLKLDQIQELLDDRDFGSND